MKDEDLISQSAAALSVAGAFVGALIFEGYLEAVFSRQGTFWVKRRSLEEFLNTYCILDHLSPAIRTKVDAGLAQPEIRESEVGRDFYKRSHIY